MTDVFLTKVSLAVMIYITVVHNISTWFMLRKNSVLKLLFFGGKDFLESSLSPSRGHLPLIAAQGRGVRTVQLLLSVFDRRRERTASPRDLPPKPQLITSEAWRSPVQIFFEDTAASLGF